MVPGERGDAAAPLRLGSQQVCVVRRGGTGVEGLLGAGVSGVPCRAEAGPVTARAMGWAGGAGARSRSASLGPRL